MSKGLEALKNFREHYIFELDEEESLNIIEKELKALEIIKEHIKLGNYKYNSEETYGLTEYTFFISKEEYDLLNEVLVCH